MRESQITVGDEVFSGGLIRRGIGTLEAWHEEGLGRFSLAGERLHIDAREGGYTAFYRTPLPADAAVQYRVMTLPPRGQNNMNLLAHCRPPTEGWPIVELGRYKGYRAMPNYIVTFVGGVNEETGEAEYEGRQRLRRNPDFHLMDERFEVPSELEREYQLTLVIQGGRVRYYIDGARIFDWQDPDPIDGGYFGFRTYRTVEEYWDLTMLAL